MSLFAIRFIATCEMPSYPGRREIEREMAEKKKPSKKFNIFRAVNRTENKDIPKTFQIKDLKDKRHSRLYTYVVRKIYGERNRSEPKPLVDVIEKKDEVIVVAEFAGIKKESLKTHVENQRLTFLQRFWTATTIKV